MKRLFLLLLLIFSASTLYSQNTYVDPQVRPEQQLAGAIQRGEIDTVRSLLDQNPGLINNRDVPPLITAAQGVGSYTGNKQISIPMLKLLIERGANVNARGSMGRTPLMIAVGYLLHSPEAAKLLIAAGANVNAADNDGETVIMCAVHEPYARYRGNSVALIKLLIACGADLKTRDKFGNTVLMHAGSNLEAVKFLMKHGSTITAKNYFNNNVLFKMATEEGAIDAMKFAVSKGVDPKVVDKNGTTPLHGAVMYINAEVVEFLVSKGADANAKDKDGITPYMMSLNGVIDPKVVKALVSGGADLNTTNKLGMMPIHMTADTKLVADLIAKGMDVNARDNSGATPLHYAVFNLGSADCMFIQPGTSKETMDARCKHCKELVDLLVSKGADINAKDKYGRTPLHYAAGTSGFCLYDSIKNSKSDGTSRMAIFMSICCLPTAKELITNGADVNAKDKNGVTPLHLAGTKTLIKMMIEKGADVKATDNEGKTLLHYIANSSLTPGYDIDEVSDKNSHEDSDVTRESYRTYLRPLIKLLVDKGADIDAWDNQGRTPLSYVKPIYGTDPISDVLMENGATE